MHDRFDQEFYRSQWQRVLPIGPDGIQPYVRTGRSSGLSAVSSAGRRRLTMLAALARGVIAVWRRLPIGMAPAGGGAASATRCGTYTPS